MLLEKFKEYINTHHLFQTGDLLLLAVSGGVDSVVLCELCRQAGYRFLIAHCNFQLRGAESDRDEDFVKSLGEQYGVEVLVKQFDTAAIAASAKKSIETTARDLRYQWFHGIVEDSHSKIHCILTAHHADDNIETVVMNFFRGTGIAGIRGILPKQGKLIRSLLFARRKELEDFASANGLNFVTDSSNLLDDYSRNLFRNKILPLVNEVYPEASGNVLNNIHRFSDAAILYQQSIDLYKKKLIEKKGNEVHLPVLKLQKTNPLHAVLFEIIRDFGFTSHQTAAVAALLQSETGRYIQSATHRIIKNRQWLIISPNQTTRAQHILIGATDSSIRFQTGGITIETHPIGNDQLSMTHSIAQLDAALIQFPLLLRQWKQGDYFYPLGMKKKKKLSRFLIDQKLPLTQKEQTWVVEMDKKIIWVVGMRIDNRFKVTGSTQQVLKLEWVKNGDAPIV